MATTDSDLALRITVVAPPRGVQFGVQRGKLDLIPPTTATEAELTFDLSVRVGRRPDGAPNLLGPYAHGTPTDRFVYIASGSLVGHGDACWRRRAKVRLAGITWSLIEATLATPGAILTASIVGTAKDGGPVCASVPLLGDGWQVSLPPRDHHSS